MTRWRVRELVTADLGWVARIIAGHPLWAPYGMGDAAAAEARVRRLLARGEEGLALLGAPAGAQDAGKERPVGFALFTLGTLGNGGYLHLIGVAPEATGSGAGSALLAAVEATLARRGVDRLLLLCNTRNLGAQRFYERAGYEPVGLLRDWAVAGQHERIYLKRPLVAQGPDEAPGPGDGGDG